MSVRNGELYIKEAVDSILNQTYENYNFLIIDNASIDNTRLIIQGFKDSRIKLVELSEDIGQTSALNKGLNIINTKYIARMDADDISNKNRLSLQVEFLSENPDIVLLGSNCEYINSRNEVVGIWETPTTHLEIINSFHKHNPFAHSSVIFNKEKVVNLGYYPESYVCAQDLALWVKICSKYKVANLEENTTKIRLHDQQATFDPKLKEKKIIEEINIMSNIKHIPGLKKRSIIRLNMKLLYAKLLYYKNQLKN